MAIDNYLQHALRLPLADITDLCEFLSSNVMEKKPQPKVRQKKTVRSFQEVELLMNDVLFIYIYRFQSTDKVIWRNVARTLVVGKEDTFYLMALNSNTMKM